MRQSTYSRFALKARKDKERYQKEMEDYEPPADFKAAKKGKGKKKKDPNAPKRGQSSFMFFSNEVRSKVKEENPDFSFGEIVSFVD